MRSKGVLVGRFQPFHKGHLYRVMSILMECESLTIVLGSALDRRTPQNPFTADEREAMIWAALDEHGIKGVEIVRVEDVGNHAKWVDLVVSSVGPFSQVYSNDPLTVALFRDAGHEVIELPLHRRVEYSGTEVRKRLLDGGNWRPLVPDSVAAVLDGIDAGARLRAVILEGGKDQEGQDDRE